MLVQHLEITFVSIDKCTGCHLEVYQRRQIVPREVLFCYCCRLYKEKIHYCTRTLTYLNIDYHNLCLFEGNNPDEVEGTHARGGRVEMFDSLKEMRNYLTKLRLTKIEKLKVDFYEQMYEYTIHNIRMRKTT